jgi:hypothetical protein
MLLEVSIMKGSVLCTLRLEEGIYTCVKELARARHTSFNELVQGVLADMLKKEEQKNLYDAFSRAGEDHDTADIGYAVSAQREVVERHQ